jgi:acyl carrier protein
MTETVESQVRAYVVDHFLFGQGGEKLGSEDSFLEKGLIDSTGVLEVVMFLEERFGIKVQDDELVPENLDSVGRIARFVERKRQ